jgi:isopropylmalate/homocitrate/citramalate synthase
MPDYLQVCGAGPRDGLQNQSTPVSIEDDTRCLDGLVEAGSSSIEVTSYGRRESEPQMADVDQIVANEVA